MRDLGQKENHTMPSKRIQMGLHKVIIQYKLASPCWKSFAVENVVEQVIAILLLNGPKNSCVI